MRSASRPPRGSTDSKPDSTGWKARFDGLEGRVDRLETKVDAGFTEIRGKLDQTTAGLGLIVKLLSPGAEDS